MTTPNNQLQSQQTAPAKVPLEDRKISYVPWGGNEAIELSIGMVKTLIAVPTKSGKTPSDRDCMRFLMLCKGKRANPFEGDCYLTGYDTQTGPQFSMICGVELFLKRAEQSQAYEGYESGVIVQRGEDLVETEGAFVFKDDIIIGAWCKVHRSDRRLPTLVKVRFDVYNTDLSRWKKDPAGMIEKVAISQAHRKAYPTSLGGLYSAEEMQGVIESSQIAAPSREPVGMPRALGDTPQTKTLEAGGAGDQGGTGGAGAGSTGTTEPGTNAERIAQALADLDTPEDWFVNGLILIKYANVPKSTKAIDDLREDVIDRIWTEGLDDLINTIKAAEAKK